MIQVNTSLRYNIVYQEQKYFRTIRDDLRGMALLICFRNQQSK